MNLDIKKRLEDTIISSIRVVTNSEGEWDIEDSSVRMAVDDINTQFNVTERDDE